MVRSESWMSDTERRDVLKMAGGTALAAALAGCSGFLGEESVEQPAEDADVPDEPVQIGAQTFIEGAASVLGQDHIPGYEIAVDRINEAGGIAGREVELEIVEEGEGAVENYERFVDQGKDVVIGLVSSGSSTAVGPVAEDRGTIHITVDGATVDLYEEVVPDPQYMFRVNPPDVGEAVMAAVDAVERLGGPDQIDTYASVNQNYTWGQTQHRQFTAAFEQLTGAELVYEGFPEQGAEDYSTHVEAVTSEEPDMIFSSHWGGDLVLLMRQFAEGGGFEAVDLFEGSLGTSILSEVDASEVDEWGEVAMGGRTYIMGNPPDNRYPPGAELRQEVLDRGFEDIMPLTGSMNNAYAAITWYATAAEKAVARLGRWPSDEELAEFMSGHAYWTPAGFHYSTPESYNGRQGYTSVHQGLVQTEGGDVIMDDVNTFDPTEVTPPPGMMAADWIDGW